MAKLLPVDEFDLIIFGGTGDLAMRKLLPALYHRDRDGQFTGASRIIALGRSKLSRKQYLADVEDALRRNLAEGDFEAAQWKTFSARIQYAEIDASSPKNWDALIKFLDGKEDRIRVAYLATAPSLFGPIAKGLKKNGLVTDSSRIVLEKPLGRDLASASEINDQVGKCFRENQIYRIDHYLGKETVQNLLALRFANSLFEPLWRRGAVDHVQARCATWCRTTSCNLSVSRLWRHRRACIMTQCVTRRSRFCAPCGPSMRMSCAPTPSVVSTRRARSRTRPWQATMRNSAALTAGPRRLSHSRSKSTIGAGQTCRFTYARASG
jgi:hypothetical protein